MFDFPEQPRLFLLRQPLLLTEAILLSLGLLELALNLLLELVVVSTTGANEPAGGVRRDYF